MTCELGPGQSQGLGQNIKWVGYTCYQFFIKDHRLNIHTYIHVHVCPSTTNIQDQQKTIKTMYIDDFEHRFHFYIQYIGKSFIRAQMS